MEGVSLLRTVTGDNDGSAKHFDKRGTYRIATIRDVVYHGQIERSTILRKLESSAQKSGYRDTHVWLWSEQGEYTAALCYQTLIYQGMTDRVADIFWKIRIPSKIHAFIWLVARIVILTWDYL